MNSFIHSFILWTILPLCSICHLWGRLDFAPSASMSQVVLQPVFCFILFVFLPPPALFSSYKSYWCSNFSNYNNKCQPGPLSQDFCSWAKLISSIKTQEASIWLIKPNTTEGELVWSTARFRDPRRRLYPECVRSLLGVWESHPYHSLSARKRSCFPACLETHADWNERALIAVVYMLQNWPRFHENGVIILNWNKWAKRGKRLHPWSKIL